MDVAVDLIVFGWSIDEWQVLLIERGHPPFEGSWALPGGFVDPDEDLPDAARRELLEETSVRVEQITQIGAFGMPDRDPRKRVISVTYCAMLAQIVASSAGDDAARAQWFSLKTLPMMAFDHNDILREGLKQMKNHYLLVGNLPIAEGADDRMSVSFMNAKLNREEV